MKGTKKVYVSYLSEADTDSQNVLFSNRIKNIERRPTA
jgi:hypothetical protein